MGYNSTNNRAKLFYHFPMFVKDIARTETSASNDERHPMKTKKDPWVSAMLQITQLIIFHSREVLM